MPALWAADSTSEKDRKRLLRALIADVTITSQPEGREVLVGIRWRSGAAEQHTIQRPPSVNDTTRTPPATVELIRRLARRAHQHRDRRRAERHRAAHRQGPPVRRARRASHPPRPQHPHDPTPHDGELTVNEVAERLGVSPGVIYDWISHHKLAAHRDRTNRLRIPFDPAIEQECRERIANSSHIPQTKIAATGGAV